MLLYLVESTRYELAGMRGCANYTVILGSSQVSLTARQLTTHTPPLICYIPPIPIPHSP